MVERTGYMDGEPCWADLVTTDSAAAQEFYASVFGWTYLETGPELGHYVVCLLDGRPVAGLTPPLPESPDPIWRVHLACSDVDAAAALVVENGGTILSSPTERLASGRQAIAADPTGAVVGLWRGTTHIGSNVVGVHGSPAWTGLTTNDGPAADGFYRALFGYEQVQTGDGETLDHTEWSLKGEKVCGRMAMGPGYPEGVPSHWMPYFGVADADAAAKAASGGGGKVEFGPADAPIGKVVILRDPTDAVCCVVEVAD